MLEQNISNAIAPQNMIITIGNTEYNLVLDSGSVCFFSDDTAENIGTVKTPIKFNEWQILRAKFTVVADGFIPFFGRKSFDLLGIIIMQKPCPKVEINNFDPPCKIKMTMAKEFLELISKIVKSKHQTVNSKLTQKLASHTQTRTKIPGPSTTKT